MIYRLTYKPENSLVGDRIEYASSFWQKGIGLVGRETLAKGQGLWLPNVSSIHTFGLRFPIDVLFLDRNLRSTLAVRQLAPGKISIAPAATRHCIELAAGSFSNAQYLTLSEQWTLEPTG